MMDEETAKTKWCPMVRFKSSESGSGPAFNRQRVASDLDDVNCIGSRCMAWRERAQERNNGDIEVLGYCGAFGGQS